ncbi:DMT family transporter [Candidatus Saccharibacteria bacterium]|nr:MAG: DMT family transporter [Candidatus Saccharibacteria bacterium]
MLKVMSKVSSGYLYACVGALAFGIYALINRYVYVTYEVPVFKYTVTFLAAGAFFALLSLLLTHRKNLGVSFDVKLRGAVVNGVLAGTGLAVFVFGQGYTTAANASILATTTIITTAIFSSIMLKDKLTRAQLGWFVIMFLGFYIAIVGLKAIEINKGDLIVVSSSLILGFTNVYSKLLMKHYPAPTLADIRLLVGGFFFLLIGLVVFGKSVIITQAGLWPLLAGFFFWITIRAFFTAIHYINPVRALMIANTHPVFTPIVGAVLLNEVYSWNKFVGALIVVGSIYYINKNRMRSDVQKEK